MEAECTADHEQSHRREQLLVTRDQHLQDFEPIKSEHRELYKRWLVQGTLIANSIEGGTPLLCPKIGVPHLGQNL